MKLPMIIVAILVDFTTQNKRLESISHIKISKLISTFCKFKLGSYCLMTISVALASILK